MSGINRNLQIWLNSLCRTMWTLWNGFFKMLLVYRILTCFWIWNLRRRKNYASKRTFFQMRLLNTYIWNELWIVTFTLDFETVQRRRQDDSTYEKKRKHDQSTSFMFEEWSKDVAKKCQAGSHQCYLWLFNHHIITMKTKLRRKKKVLKELTDPKVTTVRKNLMKAMIHQNLTRRMYLVFYLKQFEKKLIRYWGF